MAVGDMSAKDGEDVGSAIRTEVRVVESGIEAERRERKAVWRRWGRRVRDCMSS